MYSALKKPELIFIGGSAGALSVIKKLLNSLPSTWQTPIVVVIHLKENSEGVQAVLQHNSLINVKEVEDKEFLQKGVVYIAVSGYHLLFERDKSLSLLMDEPINFSRPSIDLCLESALRQFKNKLLIIILSGANADGTAAIESAKSFGATVWVQEPEECKYKEMTSAVFDRGLADKCYESSKIIEELHKLELY